MSERGRIRIIMSDMPREKQLLCPLFSIAKHGYVRCETTECAFWIQHDGYNGKWGHCGIVHPGHHGLNWKLEGDNYA